jgi:hypothetical protein
MKLHVSVVGGTITLLVFVWLGNAASAAPPRRPQEDSGSAPAASAVFDDNVAEVLASIRQEPVAAKNEATDVSAPRARRVVPGCDGNQPTLTDPLDALCPQATAICAATPEPTDMMFWFFTGPPGVPTPTADQWTRTGQACLRPDQIPGTTAAPTVTAHDFRRLPLPAGRVHIQPGTRRTLINIPTNLYVEATTTILPTTVLGTPVRVRATPTSYDWTFGDGHTLHTTDPGAPYPDLRTPHTYTTPGTMTLTLATTYTGEYALPGGPWIPIDGTATVTSPTQPLTVIAARAELVQDPLAPT